MRNEAGDVPRTVGSHESNEYPVEFTSSTVTLFGVVDKQRTTQHPRYQSIENETRKQLRIVFRCCCRRLYCVCVFDKSDVGGVFAEAVFAVPLPFHLRCVCPRDDTTQTSPLR